MDEREQSKTNVKKIIRSGTPLQIREAIQLHFKRYVSPSTKQKEPDYNFGDFDKFLKS